jgi:hypothetical protein
MSSLGGVGYGKVKAALGWFDERRLLLELRWAESVLRGFGAPPGELRAEVLSEEICWGPGYRAGVAQLVEHLICNQAVGGSNPFASSRFFGAQSIGRSR